MELLLILCILLGLIGIGLPIAFALVCIAIGIFWMGDIDQLIVAQRLYRGVQSFPLLAVPLFILAGQIMSRSGISGQLIEFAKTLVGQMRGGLAAVNVVTSMFFAGMSGTSMSDTAAVGGMIIDPMIKRGYSRPFTAAVTAASSTIGIIIPPSVPMVILGAYLGISTGALFAAGLMAGVLLGVALIIVAWIISVREGYPVEAPFSGKRMVVAFGKALPALLMPTIILGGILGGIFTPTEASAVAVVYGIFVGMFYYRTLKLRVLYQTFCEAAVLSGAVMLPQFVCGHGLRATFENKLAATDMDGHKIVLLNDTMQELSRMDCAERPGLGRPFNHPCDCTQGPDRRYYVADGYGNSAVHIFDPKLCHLKTFGHPGTGPGAFSTPHSLLFDSQGRLCVADRENNCVQLFDTEGRWLGQIEGLHKPMALALTPDGLLLVSDQTPRLSAYAPNGELVGRCRTFSTYGHGLAVHGNGTIIIAEMNPDRVTLLFPMPLVDAF
ncbi:TRAP transporter large permease subunit [Sulfitobacter sp.]|uniref:TRAP transporter large permease subunit n=1 Tax=Sulfitobacter sp. TaxID=1903071 RepID=UPI0025E48EFA|nr:TRAP transporter large permease subunit [Sulfitobacter sp.]